MASTSSTNKPFASVSPSDHRAAIWVTTLICLTIVSLGIATRVWTRFKAFGSDDFVIVAAFIVALAEFCIIIGGLEKGLGQSTEKLSEGGVGLVGQIFLASEALCILTIYLVKHSVLCTVERLLAPDQKRQRLVCWIFHGILVLCALSSLLVLTINCSAASLLTPRSNDTCPYQTPRWIAIATLDSTTDLLLFIAFTLFISSLHLQTRLKFTVTILLAFRLGSIPFAALHTRHIALFAHPSSPTPTNPGLRIVAAIVWQQLDMSYALLSALLIALKAFLSSFDVHHGWGENGTFKASSLSQSAGGAGGKNSNPNYALKPLSKTGKEGSVSRSWEEVVQEPMGRRKGGRQGYVADVRVGREERDDGGSVGSGGSQHPIIRYEQRFEVTTERQTESPVWR